MQFSCHEIVPGYWCGVTLTDIDVDDEVYLSLMNEKSQHTETS